MRFGVLASDYDRTLADDGRLDPLTVAAVERLRASGRRMLLVTGRRFDDLLEVCPELGMFDLVIAENGAVLHDPAARTVDMLRPPPPASFLGALEVARVPFERGRVVVASVVPYDEPIREAIAALHLPLHLEFNRESVMVLPEGSSKGSGLCAALERLGVTRAETVAVGDAENDVSLLLAAGLGVAVANAVPSLKAVAHLVTAEPSAAGVRELIDSLVRDDLAVVQGRAS